MDTLEQILQEANARWITQAEHLIKAAYHLWRSEAFWESAKFISK